jgi:DNA-directed RNA polymerase subunit RPC12/RpoP
MRCACGAVYHADDQHAGRQIRCTNCGAILSVVRDLAHKPKADAPMKDLERYPEKESVMPCA